MTAAAAAAATAIGAANGSGAVEVTADPLMPSNLVAIVTVIISLIMMAITIFRYISGQVDSVRRETEAMMTAKVEQEAKSRHDLNNHYQVIVGNLDRDIKSLRTDMVPRADMQTMENRITTTLTKLEGKLDGIVSSQGERTAQVQVLAAEMKGMNDRLATMDKKLDDQRGSG